jgi:hypothetical protein
MPNYMLRSEEASRLQSNAPGAQDIQNALASMSVPADVQSLGAPRITRTGCVGFFLTACNLTDVAQPFSASSDQVAAQVARIATAALSAIPGSDWGNGATVTPYNPSVNGDLSLWASGQAAVTQSTNDFPSVWTPVENPVGPTIAGVNVPRGGVDQGVQDLAPAVPLLAILGVLGLGTAGLYLAWPWLAGARASASSSQHRRARLGAYANPRRRPRRRARRRTT